MGLTTLDRKTGSGLHVLVAGESDACDQLWQWQRASTADRVGRIIRGKKCLTLADLFDEFAAAWQFPCYFGENWDALEECLTDLEWLPASDYLLLVTNAAHVLEKDTIEQRRVFWHLVHRLARSWSQTRQPPVAFHVVAHATHQELEILRLGLNTAGISYAVLP
jgi:RNAse (barnase) inhibitor barstar